VVETNWLAKSSGLSICSLNHIPALIVYDAHLESVKQTRLVILITICSLMVGNTHWVPLNGRRLRYCSVCPRLIIDSVLYPLLSYIDSPPYPTPSPTLSLSSLPRGSKYVDNPPPRSASFRFSLPSDILKEYEAVWMPVLSDNPRH